MQNKKCNTETMGMFIQVFLPLYFTTSIKKQQQPAVCCWMGYLFPEASGN